MKLSPRFTDGKKIRNQTVNKKYKFVFMYIFNRLKIILYAVYVYIFNLLITFKIIILITIFNVSIIYNILYIIFIVIKYFPNFKIHQVLRMSLKKTRIK